MTTVYRAAKVITMDRNHPAATHVAVRDGIIVGVGGPDCGDGWGRVTLDERYADNVLMPGLIEAHAHVSAGGVWRYAYCGHYQRTDPDGRDWPGLSDNDALIARLRDVAANAPTGESVIAWGFDPNFIADRRLDRDHLDKVSTDHPVVVLHSNGHLMTVNSLALERAGLTRDTNIEGV
ncbi:MAG: amidohydrolase family protein, partial [Pseudomonadota bacterium]